MSASAIFRQQTSAETDEWQECRRVPSHIFEYARIGQEKAPQLTELQGFNSRGMAERTGLEPATSNVTGWRSNQLSYRSIPVRVARKLGDDPSGCNTYFCEK